jgi:hypothetical protein
MSIATMNLTGLSQAMQDLQRTRSGVAQQRELARMRHAEIETELNRLNGILGALDTLQDEFALQRARLLEEEARREEAA